jgi:hypothetical protein
MTASARGRGRAIPVAQGLGCAHGNRREPACLGARNLWRRSAPFFAVIRTGFPGDCGALAVLLVLWVAARRWWTSDIASTLVLVAFAISLGCAAARLRTRLVGAPVIASETGPVMLEAWVQEFEPGNRRTRLLLRGRSIPGRAMESWPQFVRVTHSGRLEVAPRRFVRCWFALRPPPSSAMPVRLSRTCAPATQGDPEPRPDRVRKSGSHRLG